MAESYSFFFCFTKLSGQKDPLLSPISSYPSVVTAFYCFRCPRHRTFLMKTCTCTGKTSWRMSTQLQTLLLLLLPISEHPTRSRQLSTTEVQSSPLTQPHQHSLHCLQASSFEHQASFHWQEPSTLLLCTSQP